MNIIKDLYELTPAERKNSSIKQIRKLRQDELNHITSALKRLLTEEFESETDQIIIRIKKQKNGKNKMYFDKIKSKNLRKDVENFVTSAYPIVC